MSRFEEIINEMEEYLDNCKFSAFSRTNVIVDRDQLVEYLEELRLKTPDEIKKYQRMISNKEAILADAKENAEQILHAAQVQTQELINEHEIMQRAYAQAQDMIDKANIQAQQIIDAAVNQSNDIKQGAVDYTDQMLAKLQLIIDRSISDNNAQYQSLISGLNSVLSIVNNNRSELQAIYEEKDQTENVGVEENAIPEAVQTEDAE